MEEIYWNVYNSVQLQYMTDYPMVSNLAFYLWSVDTCDWKLFGGYLDLALKTFYRSI